MREVVRLRRTGSFQLLGWQTQAVRPLRRRSRPTPEPAFFVVELPAMKYPWVLVLGFAAALPVCFGQSGPTAQTISTDPNDWPMYNHDPLGTRFNSAERALSSKNVRELGIKWMYPTAGDVYATPAVVDNTVYAGDSKGVFYALTSGGRLLWTFNAAAGITSSALVTNRMVFFGDQGGNIYGLDRNTGDKIWSVRPNSHPLAAIWGSPAWADGGLIVGIASNEEDAAQKPGSTYPCCTFRGSAVRLNPDTGNIVWQTSFISDAESRVGAAGAPVWSTPTYDANLGFVFITTGNNYRAPGTALSDSFIALDIKTGEIRWSHQTRANDDQPNDYDFGDSPQIYTLASGQKVVGAGQKSGVYWVLDAASGLLVGQNQAVPFCIGTEGLFADSAVADQVVVVNGQDCNVYWKDPYVPRTGRVIGLSPDGSRRLWQFTSWFAPTFSGIAIANGIVYVNASGVLSTLYALDLKTGSVLHSTLIAGGFSGPSVSRGTVYLGAGFTLASGGIPSVPGIIAVGIR
jgi:polyvinyl alcohol dehydrogenase (cytochrome)